MQFFYNTSHKEVIYMDKKKVIEMKFYSRYGAERFRKDNASKYSLYD